MDDRTRIKINLLNQVFSYLAIGAMIFLAIGLRNIDNYIDWFIFPMIMIATGLLSAALVFGFLSHLIPEIQNHRNKTGIGLLVRISFTFSLTFFGLGSMINEASFQNKKCSPYIIKAMSTSGGSKGKGHFIFISNDNKTERLDFGRVIYENHRVGDKIDLCVITGVLGFKYYKINSNANLR